MLAWLVVTLGLGGSAGNLTGSVSWIFLLVTAMYFGASYHLAYAGGRSALRRNPIALVVAPVLLILASVVVAVIAMQRSGDAAIPILRLMLISVFTLTGWHYVKQSFGVAMLTIRSRGLSISRPEVLALRYSLYPVWLYQVMNIYGESRSSTYRGFDVSVGVVPVAAEHLIQWIAIGSALAAGAVIVSLALRLGGLPPAGLWATYLAAALWFVFSPDYVSAGIVLGGVHGLQYLACAHRAEVDRAVEGGEERLMYWWACVFGGAAAGGILIGNFLPGIIEASKFDVTLPGMYGSLLFVILNLHHYAIDATIWRSGGEHLRRIAHGPALAATDEVASQPGLPTPVLA